MGVVARRSDGSVIAWRRHVLAHVTCPELAESLAARYAVQLAINWSMHRVIVERGLFERC